MPRGCWQPQKYKEIRMIPQRPRMLRLALVSRAAYPKPVATCGYDGHLSLPRHERIAISLTRNHLTEFGKW
jgi:hypothetical protein